ncbi:phage shock protein operon transcriptional activator [Thiolapillus sp.]
MNDSPRLIGESAAFLETLERVSAVAALDRPVLLVGERGTGKEQLVERLHYLSPRWEAPLVKLNCATLPESLLESELFGYEAGAFTGATRRHAGRFERAAGGTLFLDEIDAMSLRLQEKLLRVVEYGTFERLGGDRTLAVDVRVVGASNADLPALAAAGRFRSDLLDRLAFEVITLPPLRFRRDDIPLLAEHFARRMTRELGRDHFPGFAPEALAQLMDHDWPGNVRELRNLVERAVYRTPPGEPVTGLTFDPWASPWRPRRKSPADEAPPAAQRQPATAVLPDDLVAHLEAEERRILKAALAAHQYDRKRTAAALGLTYAQLRARLRKHGLARKQRPRARRGLDGSAQEAPLT